MKWRLKWNWFLFSFGIFLGISFSEDADTTSLLLHGPIEVKLMLATFDKVVILCQIQECNENHSQYEPCLILAACPGDWLWSWLGPDWDVASCCFKSKCWILQVALYFALLWCCLQIQTDFYHWYQLATDSCHSKHFFFLSASSRIGFQKSFRDVWSGVDWLFIAILQVVRCLWRWSDRLLRVPSCSLRWRRKPRRHHPCICCHGPVAEVAFPRTILPFSRSYSYWQFAICNPYHLMYSSW